MSDSSPVKIVISMDGPYLVYGSVPLSVQAIATNADGEAWEWESGAQLEVSGTYALCRCGQSSHAPFCDGTHARAGFDGAEVGSRKAFDEEKTVAEGPGLVLEQVRPLSAVGRFCDSVIPSWDLVEKTDSPEARELLIHQVHRCPSGRFVIRDRTTNAVLEPTFGPSIAVVEDPSEGCSGPLWVRGGIAIQSQSGETYAVRNRVTLCRCGQSSNKPFCDGSHLHVRFQDGLDAASTPGA